MTDPDSLFARLAGASGAKLPPVSHWHPERSGSSGMRIDRNGRWYYLNSEIQRPEMVRLFSTILRRDADGTHLVTPVEKLTIDVEDAPFIAVDMEARGDGSNQSLVFLTNVDDLVVANAAHPIRLRGAAPEARPYVLVRAALDALISRHVFYRLADIAVPGPAGRAGVWSGGAFFPLE